MSARIEIVHLSDQSLLKYKNFPDRRGIVARSILDVRSRKPDQVYFHNKNFTNIDPRIPRDTKFILGGELEEICVAGRRKALKDAGFKVRIYKPLAISMHDYPPHDHLKKDN